MNPDALGAMFVAGAALLLTAIMAGALSRRLEDTERIQRGRDSKNAALLRDLTARVAVLEHLERKAK